MAELKATVKSRNSGEPVQGAIIAATFRNGLVPIGKTVEDGETSVSTYCDNEPVTVTALADNYSPNQIAEFIPNREGNSITIELEESKFELPTIAFQGRQGSIPIAGALRINDDGSQFYPSGNVSVDGYVNKWLPVNKGEEHHAIGLDGMEITFTFVDVISGVGFTIAHTEPKRHSCEKSY